MTELYSSVSSPHLAHRQKSRNPILLKDVIGGARPAVHDLPDDEHAFGSRQLDGVKAGCGVAEALSWSEHVPSTPPLGLRRRVDFERGNRSAVRHHAANAGALAVYRAEHPRDFTPAPVPRRQVSVIPSDVLPDFCYGRPGRPSTPVKAVLAHRFGAQQEELQEERYRRYLQTQVSKEGPCKIRFTKSELLRRKHLLASEPHDPVKPWKMSKFQRVPAKLGPQGEVHKAASPQRPTTSGGSLRRQTPPQTSAHEARHEAECLPRRACSTCPSAFREGASYFAAGAVSAFPSDGETETEGGDDDVEITEVTMGEGEEDTVSEGSLGETVTPPPSHEDIAMRPNPRVETKMTLWLTVKHQAQDDIQVIMGAIAGGLRSRFCDSILKVKDMVLEQVRQGLREGQQRYLAWGPEALKMRLPACQEGSCTTLTKPSILSPVVFNLIVIHRTAEELEQVMQKVVELVGLYRGGGVVQVRRVHPCVQGSATPEARPVGSGSPDLTRSRPFRLHPGAGLQAC